MPELPEVEAARLIARRVAVGRRIVAVECADDPIVFERLSATAFRRALLGRRVTRARRHGKHLWLELDRRPWPCLHFGMTGGLHTPRAPGVRLVSSRRAGPDAAWPPRFTKLRLRFQDGGELAFADARRLGRVRLRDDPAREPPISLLGFDALRGLPPPRRFAELLRARAAPVKALLLDQSFAAGVGNWVADEVLFQAGIAPRRSARTLTDAEARRLHARLRSVLETAVRARADSDRYPRRWLFHRRWRGRRRWDRRGVGGRVREAAIRYDTIGGRTTAWIPTVQK